MMSLDMLFKRYFNKDIRKLINYISTSTDIDLTNVSIPFDKIKGYINKGVKSLKLPEINNYIVFLSELSRFKSLETLYLSNLSLVTSSELDLLSELGIKEVYVGDVILDYSKMTQDRIAFQSNGVTRIIYNGMIVNVMLKNRLIPSYELILEVKHLNKSSIMNLIKDVNISEFNSIRINVGYNIYNIRVREKVIEELNIESNSIFEVESFYNYVVRENFKISKVNVKLKNDSYSYEELKRLSYLFGDKIYDSALISFVSQNLISEICVENNKTILKFDYSEDLYKVEEYLEFLSSSNYKVSDLEFSISSFDKYDENFDMKLLKRLSKKTNLLIKYSNVYLSNYEDFYAMRETVLWYRRLINDYNLSQLEKIFFAYDIVKGFSYKSYSSGQIGRAPHMVINNEYIVCTGYSNLINEILNSLDNGISSDLLHIRNSNHARNIVRVDDDKYDIHGIYELDATFDSNVEERKYDILGYRSYMFFLVSMSEHGYVFMNDEYPFIVSYLSTKKSDRDKTDEFIYKRQIVNLFGSEVEEEKVLKYIRAKTINQDQFKEILCNVRLAEGYSEEEALMEAQKINDVNLDDTEVRNDFVASARKGI